MKLGIDHAYRSSLGSQVHLPVETWRVAPTETVPVIVGGMRLTGAPHAAVIPDDQSGRASPIETYARWRDSEGAGDNSPESSDKFSDSLQRRLTA